ncbi:hypothetical protein JCM14076_18550 [Methylosoma difficile]
MKKLATLSVLAFAAIASNATLAGPINRMVANWHFDEGQGLKPFDSSGYNKHGQLGATAGIDVSDPLWVSRRFDNAALQFNGSQYVKVTTANHLEPPGISVEAWVKADVTDSTILPYVVAKSGNACQFAAYALYLHDDLSGKGGVPYFYVSDGSTYVESPEGAPSLWDGKWHHLVGSYDKVKVRLFVDGVQISTGTPNTSPIGYASFTNKNLYIGDYDGDSNICNDYNGGFVGSIDEVRIWNKPLSAAEVASRFAGY